MRAVPRRYAWIAVMAVVVGMSGDSVGACRCAQGPVCGFGDADVAADFTGAVFVGVAITSKPPITRFRVERMLFGAPAAEITLGPLVAAANGSPNVVSNCDLGFATGKRYLVQAYRHPETGDLVTSLCSRTREMNDPRAAADVAYFEALKAKRQTAGWLSGVVEERHYDSTREPDGRVRGEVARPLRGIRVTATSPTGQSRSTRSDQNGWYVFSGLTAGEGWTLKADLPAPFEPHDGMVASRGFGPQSTVMWLKNTSCAEADIDARVGGRIAGQILDEEGRPGRGLTVHLRRPASIVTDPWVSPDEQVLADEQGRFEFWPLPAGEFVVGVDLSRTEMTDSLDRRRYYPGVRQLGAATVIRLRRGEQVRLASFRLPPLPTERTIRIVVSAPTPDVAARTRVFLFGATKRLLELVDGSIALRLPIGAAYDLFVEPPPGYSWQIPRSPDIRRRGNEQRIQRDDTDRTIEISILPR